MIPPWVPEAPDDSEGDTDQDVDAGDGGSDVDSSTAPAPIASLPSVPIAPARRFAGARLNLGNFATNGDQAAMRRGVGQYFKGGYGGGATAARRFGGTARTAAGLYGALAPSASTGTGSPLDHNVLSGRSADDIMDAIIEAVRPVDGTQDSESSRAAIKDALSDLLDRFPDADLLNLLDEQRAFAVERFVAIDVFRRLQLDLGKVIQDKAPTLAAAMSRLREVREYVKECVAASFRQLRDAGRILVAGQISKIVRAAVREAVMVFQGYAE